MWERDCSGAELRSTLNVCGSSCRVMARPSSWALSQKMGMWIQQISFIPILLAPKNLPSGIFVQKSDKCELGEVTQYAVIAEDLRRPLPAAFNMKMIERENYQWKGWRKKKSWKNCQCQCLQWALACHYPLSLIIAKYLPPLTFMVTDFFQYENDILDFFGSLILQVLLSVN